MKSKNFFIAILILLSLISFYKINELNYIKTREIKKNIVEHPENLPTKEAAKNSTLGFSNLRADLYWLQAIQYIGGNAIRSEYKKYLYTMLDVITELNPFFEHPYVIGELLLPSYNERYENLSEEKQGENTNQAIKIGEKGIKNFCDPQKLALIKGEYNLTNLWTQEKYKNACKGYKIPYNLAFIYYYYLNDPETASYYYKVSSTVDDSLKGAKIMAAIMQGKGGNREKAFFMFLNMASQVEKDNEVCTQFASELNSLAFGGKLKNDSFTVKKIEETRKLLFPLDEESAKKRKEENQFDNIQCQYYLDKAIRELNLSYIDEAHKEYRKNHSDPAHDAKVLLDEGYISFLPTDPQQEEGEEYGIIYTYNRDLKRFDYEMGKYGN